MTQGNDGVHAYGATCGVDAGYQTEEHGKRHCAQAEPAGKAEVLYERGPLSGGKAVDNLVDDKAHDPGKAQAEHPAQQPDHAGFAEKDALYISMRGSHGLHDANLPVSFQDRHDHGIQIRQDLYNLTGGLAVQIAGGFIRQQDLRLIQYLNTCTASLNCLKSILPWANSSIVDFLTCTVTIVVTNGAPGKTTDSIPPPYGPPPASP